MSKLLSWLLVLGFVAGQVVVSPQLRLPVADAAVVVEWEGHLDNAAEAETRQPAALPAHRTDAFVVTRVDGRTPGESRFSSDSVAACAVAPSTHVGRGRRQTFRSSGSLAQLELQRNWPLLI